MKKSIFSFIALLLVLAITVTSCHEKRSRRTRKTEKKAATTTEKMVLRYAENQPKDYPTTLAAYKFADLVEAKTNGRIHIDVYPSAELGDEKSVIEQMRVGAIDFTRVSISPLAELDKSLNILQLPYLYKDATQMWRVLDGDLGAKFLTGVESSGLKGLSWFDAGARNFYNSKRPIRKLSDMEGLKIRVQESQLMMGMISAINANATPMPFGEVQAALKSGAIDGAENNWPSYDSTSHYTVSKYFVIDEHTRVPEMQMISKSTWNKLSEEDKQIITSCAMASARYQRELWAAKEHASEEKVKAGGAIITVLDPGEKEKFQQAMAPLYSRFGSGYESLIKEIQAK